MLRIRFKFFIEFSINYTIHDYGSQCYQKTDLVKTKEVVVNSVWIYILCYRVQTEQREVGRVLPTDNEGGGGTDPSITNIIYYLGHSQPPIVQCPVHGPKLFSTATFEQSGRGYGRLATLLLGVAYKVRRYLLN